MRQAMKKTGRLIGMGQMVERLDLSESSIERLVRRGELPMPVRVGERSVRWKLDDVLVYIDQLGQRESVAAESKNREPQEVPMN
jgi:predicted DNA-binding transcriptional regulator AlpA